MALPAFVKGKEYVDRTGTELGKYIGSTHKFWLGEPKKYKFDSAYSKRHNDFTKEDVINDGIREQNAADKAATNAKLDSQDRVYRENAAARAEQQARINADNAAIQSAINRPPPQQTSIYGQGRRRRSTSKRSTKKKSHTRRRR